MVCVSRIFDLAGWPEPYSWQALGGIPRLHPGPEHMPPAFPQHDLCLLPFLGQQTCRAITASHQENKMQHPPGSAQLEQTHFSLLSILQESYPGPLLQK